MPRIEIAYPSGQDSGRLMVYEGNKKGAPILDVEMNAQEIALMLDFLESALVRINGQRLPPSAAQPVVVIHELERPV